MPDTIAVAFALATAVPKAIFTLLPVTDKLHLPIIATSLVPTLSLLLVGITTAPANSVVSQTDTFALFPVTGTVLGIEAAAVPSDIFNH